MPDQNNDDDSQVEENKSSSLTSTFVDEMERGETTTFLQHMLAGSFAGLAEHICMYPTDVVKTRIYAGRERNRFFRVLIRSFRKEGLSIFRGLHVALMGAIPSHAFMFATYDLVKSHTPDTTFWTGVAGICGTMMHDFFATIFGVVKTRIMLYNTNSSRNIVKDIISKEGLKAFYVSYPAAVITNIPFVLAYFITYETVKKRMSELNFRNQMTPVLLAGAISGGVAGFFSNPFDLVKVLLMKRNRGYRNVVCGIKRRHGYRGFMNGATARAMYFIPSGMITWFVYESVKKFFDKRYEKEHKSDQVDI